VVAVHEAEKQELQHGPGPMNYSILGAFGMEDVLDEVGKQPEPYFLLKDQITLSPLFENLPENHEVKQKLSQWKVLHTPGHSPGSVCLYNETESILISGDTWFDGAFGRTDMYGGDEVTLQKSLSRIWKLVKPETMVYPGHDMYFKTSTEY